MRTVYMGFGSVVDTAWFHNYEYRFLLRFPDCMSLEKGHKRTETKWFGRKYAELKRNFREAGLDVAGFSEDHTIIIAQTFGLSEYELLCQYHND